MIWMTVKYMITAGIIVAISEVVKRSDKLGGLIAALPTVTILALIWMYLEGQGQEKLSAHAYYTFWYVLPTLPMFLLFPFFLQHMPFWGALLVCALVTMACFFLTSLILKGFGIELL